MILFIAAVPIRKQSVKRLEQQVVVMLETIYETLQADSAVEEVGK